MRAHKVQVKFFVQNEEAFALEPIVPVLHDWIKKKALDELLIDVADYAHVHEGPGLLLVAHASDYYLDLGEGRPGLLYSRKREAPAEPLDRITDALRRALVAARKLEDEHLSPPIVFRGDELLFRINDRLLAPNDDETFEEVRPHLQQALDRMYDGISYSLKREGDAREIFSVRVLAPGAPAARELVQRFV